LGFVNAVVEKRLGWLLEPIRLVDGLKGNPFAFFMPTIMARLNMGIVLEENLRMEESKFKLQNMWPGETCSLGVIAQIILNFSIGEVRELKFANGGEIALKTFLLIWERNRILRILWTDGRIKMDIMSREIAVGLHQNSRMTIDVVSVGMDISPPIKEEGPKNDD
jgi:hypothetical protein